jgi:hypothetical protein
MGCHDKKIVWGKIYCMKIKHFVKYGKKLFQKNYQKKDDISKLFVQETQSSKDKLNVCIDLNILFLNQISSLHSITIL